MDPTIFCFDRFAVLAGRRELLADGRPVDLGTRAFDILLAIVRRGGQVATKDEIMNEVWPGLVVEENNLTTHITTLRRVLGDGQDGKRFILTVKGRGYRFVAPIELRSGEAAVPPVPFPDAPVPEADLARDNLPLAASSFVGRAAERAEIAARLADRPLVTLVGSGGVGKTRLAIQVALDAQADFADGVWLVELAPLGDGGLVAEALCRVLGVTLTGNRPAIEVATAFLRQKQMLLILDNCEHVLTAAAQLAAAILRHCARVRILATSRQHLAISGEAVYRVPSLPVPLARAGLTVDGARKCDAIALFAQRGADAQAGFELTAENLESVVAICRRLDGVALAIELAAARLRMLRPAEIEAGLAHQFRLLVGGDRTALPRQQTLRATIDWSHALLSPAEQRLLARQSVFADGWSLDGANAVAAEDVFDAMCGLVDKSLVVADIGGEAARYRMLESTRQYAAEKLAVAGQGAYYRRHAEYMLELFRGAGREWPTAPTDAWVRAYLPEAENLRAAIDWAFGAVCEGSGTGGGGDPALGVALVAQAGLAAQEFSLRPDMRRWVEAAMPHLAGCGDAVSVAAVGLERLQLQGRFGTQVTLAERREGIALFRAAGDRIGLNRSLRMAGVAIARPGGPNDDAQAMIEEAIVLLRDSGPNKDLASALANLGIVKLIDGDLGEARGHTEEALAMRRRLGHRTGILGSAINLAEISFQEGDLQGAIAHIEAAAAQARAWKAFFPLALALGNLAGYFLALESIAEARAAATEALALNRALGHEDCAIVCVEHLALAAALCGQTSRAATLLGYTEAYYQRTDQVRDRLEQSGFDRLTLLLSTALKPASMIEAGQIGSSMSNDEADELAVA